MGRKMKLFVAGASLLSIGVVGVFWMSATTNTSVGSKAAHSASVAEAEILPRSSTSPSTPVVEPLKLPEPSESTSPGDKVPFLDAVTVREAVIATTLKYAYLPFPSEAAKSTHVDRLAAIQFEGGSQWEDGTQDMIVLQSWRCVWLEHAVRSFEEDNIEEVQRSGMLIEQLRSFPAIQENYPSYESYLQHQVQPLIDGDGASAPTAFGSECREW